MSEIKELIEELGGGDKLHSSLHRCMHWVVESFTANDNKYSSGSRNIWGKWSPPYLETTGYLLPTLSQYKNFSDAEGIEKILEDQLNNLLSIQNADGSFPQSLENKKPIVFDTAQLLLGLITVSSRHDAIIDKAIAAIKAAMKWLKKQLDHTSDFMAYNYVEDYNPLYYSRIAWPIIQAEMIIESKASPESKLLLEKICHQVSHNEDLKNWGLYPDKPILTHNIAYTIRGIWECAQLLNHRHYEKLVKKKLHELIYLIRENGLVGSYSEDWTPEGKFICATGHAQIALLFLLVYQKTTKPKYLEPVATLLQPLLRSQRKIGPNKGALPSSIPIYGEYQRFLYTNWTQKFYADALMKILELDKG